MNAIPQDGPVCLMLRADFHAALLSQGKVGVGASLQASVPTHLQQQMGSLSDVSRYGQGPQELHTDEGTHSDIQA